MPISSSSAPRNSTTVRSKTAVRVARAALQTAFIVSDDLGAAFAERMFVTPRYFDRPAREREVLASGRRFVVDVALRSPRWNGAHTPVTAWRWGLGPTALLVHGWEGRGSQLGAFVEPLVAAGMSVVAFDAPGHGDSPGHRLYLTDLADCITSVATAVGPLHAAIAHSFGAPALLLAHLRGGVDAARNVAVSPNAIIADAIAKFSQVVALDPSDRRVFEQQLAAHTGVALDALTLDRLVAGRDAALLVIHDRNDNEVPFAHGSRLAAAWPGAILLETDGLGHRRILRDRAVIESAVAFASHGIAAPASDLVREVDRYLRP